MGATGLSTDANEYRSRLEDAGGHPDRRVGVRAHAGRRDPPRDRQGGRRLPAIATRLSEPEFERVFASGGGPPASVGHDAEGHLVVPTVALWALVPGIRVAGGDARQRLIEYLVANFNELVYV